MNHSLYRLWDPIKDQPSIANHPNLSATGFPTGGNLNLPAQVRGVIYTSLNMRIQIPSIDMDAELTGVPATTDAWLIEDLGARAGLLSGTSLPGEGYSIVVGHNHLNAAETGPFLLIGELKENDIIFVTAPDGSLRRFSVYANELLLPDDMRKLAEIAEQESSTLVLVTCENETIDGGYLNRRAVFAKPLG